MRRENFLLSVVIPMYYEEAVARECHRRLTEALRGLRYELIYVNDGSKDRTLDILKELALTDSHVNIVSFSRNFGHQAAVTAGVEASVGDCVAVIDADLQDPPELIPKMIELWREGGDVVYAKRSARKGETFFKRFTASAFYRLMDSMTSIRMPLDTGDFRLMDRQVVDAFLSLPEHSRFIRGMVAWLGFNQKPIEYVRDERFAGETKYPLKKMLKLAMDGIFSFSVKPLTLPLWVGTGLAFAAFVFLVLAGALGQLAPMTCVALCLLCLLLGILLLCVAVLGVYVGRIYEEAQARPLYIVQDRIFQEKHKEEQ